VLSKPSQQSSPRRSEIVGAPRDPRWMRVLARRELAEISSILADAGVGTYSMDDPMPRDSAEPSAPAVVAGTAQ
jgi:hypothetical protein